VRKPTLSLGFSFLLLLAPLQAPLGAQSQDAAKQQTPSTAKQAPPAASTHTEKSLLPGQFILQDGTPAQLRLSRNVSSADAHVGDSVDFERSPESIARAGVLPGHRPGGSSKRLKVIQRGTSERGRARNITTKSFRAVVGDICLVLRPAFSSFRLEE